MKFLLASFAIVLSAALMPLTAESVTLKLKPSPTTLALSPVNSGEIHLADVTINGGSVTAPVKPGSTVDVEFDWSISEAPGCPGCNIQFYIGFQGKPGICVADFGAGQGGHANVFLTAPNTVANTLIMVNETLELNCVETTIGGGGISSIVGDLVTSH